MYMWNQKIHNQFWPMGNQLCSILCWSCCVIVLPCSVARRSENWCEYDYRKLLQECGKCLPNPSWDVNWFLHLRSCLYPTGTFWTISYLHSLLCITNKTNQSINIPSCCLLFYWLSSSFRSKMCHAWHHGGNEDNVNMCSFLYNRELV